MLVHWECGCIGYRMKDYKRREQAWSIKPCDGDDNDPGVVIWERHDLRKKAYAPLSVGEVYTLMLELAELVAHGDSYRRIKTLLNIPHARETR